MWLFITLIVVFFILGIVLSMMVESFTGFMVSFVFWAIITIIISQSTTKIVDSVNIDPKEYILVKNDGICYYIIFQNDNQLKYDNIVDYKLIESGNCVIKKDIYKSYFNIFERVEYRLEKK